MSKAETMIPQLRFEGFSGEWLLRELGELVSITTGKLDANAMKENGQYDFYTSGIQKYKIDVAAFEGPAITIAGNGATVGYMHYADGKFNAYQRTYVLTDFKATRSFLFSSISLALPRKIHQEARTGSIPYIVRSMLTELAIRLPSSSKEQTKIGELFQKLDRAIELQQQKVEQSERYKKAMLQKMFPQKGETEPQLRFEGFSGGWCRAPLEDILCVNSGRDYKHLSKGDIPVFGTGGYMLSVDQALSTSDAVGIGRKGTINKPLFLKAPFWTVDTLFFLTTKQLNIVFLFYLLSQINWLRYDESTGVPSLSKRTIEKISTLYPSKEEQTKIGEFFQSLDVRIEVETKKLNHYESLKKAMLQRMFV
ncbi:restriction endonuclease subunit S [Ignatzschineria sp. RMDPL8A]|uniref:restriction endonuclease subunit S n=1 Tax=Ignatzschineria sp. RMDPL8A TaxID=2999236 RepID=UPI0024466C8A|nr:restriction endonuclease subunit S [Ignatzschineria sp. RMDPL8A]MDG9729053.1 restriction endonuclease subunit S [Ignatzschineria sp. RMDPL8A]